MLVVECDTEFNRASGTFTDRWQPPQRDEAEGEELVEAEDDDDDADRASIDSLGSVDWRADWPDREADLANFDDSEPLLEEPEDEQQEGAIEGEQEQEELVIEEEEQGRYIEY